MNHWDDKLSKIGLLSSYSLKRLPAFRALSPDDRKEMERVASDRGRIREHIETALAKNEREDGVAFVQRQAIWGKHYWSLHGSVVVLLFLLCIALLPIVYAGLGFGIAIVTWGLLHSRMLRNFRKYIYVQVRERQVELAGRGGENGQPSQEGRSVS